MRQILTGLGLVAATVAIVWAGAARSEPAKEGETFTGSAVMCDLPSQVQTLFEAAQDKTGAKLGAAYTALHALRNERGEPACLWGNTTGVTVTKVVHLGDSYGTSGQKFDTWMVDIKVDAITGSMLYGEVAKAEHSKSSG
jgi:hypothetical protein